LKVGSELGKPKTYSILSYYQLIAVQGLLIFIAIINMYYAFIFALDEEYINSYEPLKDDPQTITPLQNMDYLLTTIMYDFALLVFIIQILEWIVIKNIITFQIDNNISDSRVSIQSSESMLSEHT
jgi:hypothetical protein